MIKWTFDFSFDILDSLHHIAGTFQKGVLGRNLEQDQIASLEYTILNTYFIQIRPKTYYFDFLPDLIVDIVHTAP